MGAEFSSPYREINSLYRGSLYRGLSVLVSISFFYKFVSFRDYHVINGLLSKTMQCIVTCLKLMKKYGNFKQKKEKKGGTKIWFLIYDNVIPIKIQSKMVNQIFPLHCSSSSWSYTIFLNRTFGHVEMDNFAQLIQIYSLNLIG